MRDFGSEKGSKGEEKQGKTNMKTLYGVGLPGGLLQLMPTKEACELRPRTIHQEGKGKHVATSPTPHLSMVEPRHELLRTSGLPMPEC